jgi:hypothetical protein
MVLVVATETKFKKENKNKNNNNEEQILTVHLSSFVDPPSSILYSLFPSIHRSMLVASVQEGIEGGRHSTRTCLYLVVFTSFTAQPTIHTLYTLDLTPGIYYYSNCRPLKNPSSIVVFCPAHFSPSLTATAEEENGQQLGQGRAGPAQEYKRSRAAAHLVVDVTVQ